jgi:hypothetical protein
MKLLNFFLERRKPTGEVKQKIKLIAIIHAEIGIPMPKKNRIIGSIRFSV